MTFVGKTGLIASAGMLLAGVILLSIGAVNGGIEQVQAMAENGELSIGRRAFRAVPTTQTEKAYAEAEQSGFQRTDTIVEENVAISENIGEVIYYESIDNKIVEIAKEDEIKRLVIDWDASVNGQLRICVAPGDYFLIMAESLMYKVNGDTIKFSQKSGFQYMADENAIYIPDSWAGKEITLSIGAGNVYADVLHAEKISIEVGVGHMECSQLKSEELDVEIGAGSFDLYEFQTKNAELEIGMGSLFMSEGTITGNLYAQCGIGYLFMVLTGKETDHNYKISSVGSLTIGNVTRTGFGNDYRVDNYADSDFDVECGLGTIEIYFDE